MLGRALKTRVVETRSCGLWENLETFYCCGKGGGSLSPRPSAAPAGKCFGAFQSSAKQTEVWSQLRASVVLHVQKFGEGLVGGAPGSQGMSICGGCPSLPPWGWCRPPPTRQPAPNPDSWIQIQNFAEKSGVLAVFYLALLLLLKGTVT